MKFGHYLMYATKLTDVNSRSRNKFDVITDIIIVGLITAIVILDLIDSN
jgi:hypothetical protein